jgi:hypothetical protein
MEFHGQHVNGTPQTTAPASPACGAIQSEAMGSPHDHLTAKASSFFLITAPGVIARVQSAINKRAPDRAVTCSPRLPGDIGLHGPIAAFHRNTWLRQA